MIVAFDCLRKPPEQCRRVARYSLLEQGVDEGAGVLVVDDRDDELHAAEYRTAPGTSGRSRAPRGAYDAGLVRRRCAAGGPVRRPRTQPHDPAASSRAPRRVAATRRPRRGPRRGSSTRPTRRSAPPSASSTSRIPTGRAPGRRRRSASTRRPLAAELRRSGRRPSSPATAATAGAGAGGRRAPPPAAHRRPGRGRAAARRRSASAGRRPTSVGDDEPPSSTALAARRRRDRPGPARLDRRRATEWFERIAHTDPLTGLANDRTFARVLELELARAGRQGGEVSVAIFDVDGFAATNASAGHEAGDDMLRAVAAVLAGSVRLVDTVARFGGDEFVLVAPGSAGARSPTGSSMGSRPCRPLRAPDLGLGRRRPVPGRRRHVRGVAGGRRAPRWPGRGPPGAAGSRRRPAPADRRLARPGRHPARQSPITPGASPGPAMAGSPSSMHAHRGRFAGSVARCRCAPGSARSPEVDDRVDGRRGVDDDEPLRLGGGESEVALRERADGTPRSKAAS